jgi:serine/threonine protein kinase
MKNQKLLVIVCILWFYYIFVDIIHNKIGEGGFGSVYLCSSLKKDDSNLYAVKCIKSSKSENSAKKEQQFGYMSRLNSLHLVKYYEIFIYMLLCNILKMELYMN